MTQFTGTPQEPFERPEADYFKERGVLPCDGCNKNCFEDKTNYYMVLDVVWINEAKLWYSPDTYEGQVAKRGGEKVRQCIMCISCLETRIGRKLVPVDFTSVPVNIPILKKLGHARLSRMETLTVVCENLNTCLNEIRTIVGKECSGGVAPFGADVRDLLGAIIEDRARLKKKVEAYERARLQPDQLEVT